jgi:RNA-directed DNA polymerase
MNHEEDKPSEVPARDKQEGKAPQPSHESPDLWTRYGAERGVWSEAMLIALEKGVKGNKWFSLTDKIVSDRTLGKAWEQVRANAGSCGVDGIEVGYFEKDSQSRLLAVKEHLAEDTYRPDAIRRVNIPKPGSKETRPLGIPTVRDRIVQTALKMAIEPIFERDFSPNSFGFRPGRCTKDALRQVESHLKSGHHHVVDIDIKGYFDNIPHAKLMNLVEEKIADGNVLRWLKAFLVQPIEDQGKREIPTKGSPQGGVISPLLANIYLHPLDQLLDGQNIPFARYADDIVILAKTGEEAHHILETVRQWMEQAQLELHPEKTRIVDMTKSEAHFDFLGYRFQKSKKGKLLRLIRPKSEKKLREAIRPLTKRTNGKSLQRIIQSINPRLRGWYEYFKQAHIYEHVEMDGWVRMRLRSILRKREGRDGRGRGKDHLRWKNSYFAAHGLFSLEAARVADLMSLRSKGAKC